MMTANPLRFLLSMASGLRRSPDPRRAFGQRVYRATDAPRVGDEWAQLILDLGDGRCVAEIVDGLYLEELKSGAWMVDIGIWRGLFARKVVDHINQLAARGDIELR